MNEFSFSVPQNITVGKGSLAKLPEIAKKSGGSHAFLMSGLPGSFLRTPFRTFS